MMHITLIYAGLLGLLFLLLSFWVVKRRAQFKVMIGEGEAPEMRAAIRAHGNFAEYVPLTLLLMALCELAGVGAFWLHAGGPGVAGGTHPACHRHPDPQGPQPAEAGRHPAVLAGAGALLGAGAGTGARRRLSLVRCKNHLLARWFF